MPKSIRGQKEAGSMTPERLQEIKVWHYEDRIVIELVTEIECLTQELASVKQTAESLNERARLMQELAEYKEDSAITVGRENVMEICKELEAEIAKMKEALR